MTDILYRIAAENPALADRALMRYADLCAKQPATPLRRCQLYRQGLELKPSAAVRNKLLGYLAGVHEVPALMLAARLPLRPRNRRSCRRGREDDRRQERSDAGRRAVRSALEQAREVYREHGQIQTPMRYAVDEITGLLGKIPAAGFALLPTAGLEGWDRRDRRSRR